MFYNIVKAIVKIVFFPVFFLKSIGKKNVPKDGGVLIAANHRSNWDVIVIAATCPRQLNFMAKKELFKNKLSAFLFSQLNCFPISRGTGDIGAIKTALSRLNKGNTLLLFPEGRRVKKGQSADAKAGVAMLAIRAKVPVVPMAVIGDYKLLGKIKTVYGEPITYEEYYNTKPDMETLTKLSDNVLKKVMELKEKYS